MGELAEQAFRRHYKQIYGFVRRRSPTQVEAEDVTAGVFADAAAALDRFETGSAPVLAWLYTVAKRRLADEARRRRRGNVAVTLVAPTYSPEITHALGRALAALPDAQRDVVVLKLIRGLSFREVARTLGATEPACRMRFSRALERMRESLEKEGVQP